MCSLAEKVFSPTQIPVLGFKYHWHHLSRSARNHTAEEEHRNHWLRDGWTALFSWIIQSPLPHPCWERRWRQPWRTISNKEKSFVAAGVWLHCVFQVKQPGGGGGSSVGIQHETLESAAPMWPLVVILSLSARFVDGIEAESQSALRFDFSPSGARTFLQSPDSVTSGEQHHHHLSHVTLVPTLVANTIVSLQGPAMRPTPCRLSPSCNMR